MTLALRSDVRVGEIETALCALPQVQEATVVARQTAAGGQQLVAYVVTDGPLDPKRLQAHVESVLPNHAAPLAYAPVASLPLTDAGEVDEQALARVAVIDSSVLSECEQRLRSLPGIDQAAVVVQDDIEPLPPLHLSDLLPDWKCAFVRDADQSRPSAPQAQALGDTASTKARAISHGSALPGDFGPQTLPAALERATRESPHRGVIYIQPDGTDVLQTYPALQDEAQRIVSGLRMLGLKPQDKVLFQLDRNEDFIPAFWGCVLGGFVPVPLSIAPSYASVNSAVSKLHNTWQMLGRPIILSDSRLAPAIRSLPEQLNAAGLRVATLDELRRCEADRAWHDSRPEDLAILLLTSGSTGVPKAVMQSHRSLLSQSAGTSRLNKFSSDEVSLNWMPLDHVGGIVMFHVRDVYLACQQIHAPAEFILQDPLKWLDLIARFRATLTWAPNFAFGLVNAKEETIRERRWDLSSMRFILNGGEAIVARTARRFLRLLRPQGLPERCMHPAWGMSETSSGVTYSDGFSLDATSADDSFVEVGAPIPGFSMRIVDAQDHLVSENVIGRLQVKGASVTPGYYQNPELTKHAFSADGWFETGDLGFLRGGRLTITGREKDLIIINGVNYHSHEIEAVVEETPGVVTSYTAACAVRSSATDTDQLAVFFHPAYNDGAGLSRLLKAIRENVVQKIGVNPDYLIPVAESEIPKTAIGKIQRTQLSQRFKAGEFDAALNQVDILSGNANTLPSWFYRKVWHRKQRMTRRDQRQMRPTLLFVDGTGLGALLREEIASFGQPCVSVEMGPDFIKLASDRYRIDPQESEHYRRMLASIAADGIRIEQVLHLWTCDSSTGEIATREELELSQDRGVYSLLFLIQALAQRSGNAAPVHLHVVSTRSQRVLASDEIAYEKGPLLGLIRTAAQEMPWMHCRHVDLPAGDTKVNAAHVLGEIQTAARDREVAYRNGERWIPRLQRVDFASAEKRALPFERGGVYLLSGGLGGIGAEIAKYLLQHYQAKLLLVGRTALADADGRLEQKTGNCERTRTYRQLRELPGEVIYEVVDVCDASALQRAVEKATTRWQRPLDGVIHLAGIYQERLLTEEVRDSFAAVLHPKVFGTWTLARLLEDLPDKLFISFSSANSFFGGALVGAYSAANSFLESFTHHQRRKHSIKSYCLEWSMWDELGMSRGYPMKELTRSRGYYTISKREGLCSFVAALRYEGPHILVGLDATSRHIRQHTETDGLPAQKLCGYFSANAHCVPGEQLKSLQMRDRFGTHIACEFRQMSELPETDSGEVDRENLTRPHSDQSRMESVGPQSEVERRIASFWLEVLPISQLGIHDNFFDLGGNSLLATQIASRIQDAFQVQLSLRTALQEATVAKLAAVVQRHLNADARRANAIQRLETADARNILAKLDQLSDEQISSLLHETLGRGEEL
jgi:acyl-CoA synthetase (AMP-forming)/AMP-acid ligase II/NADP-dependent 3-hydroxy acid dehydrogenase YdfG/acyl carrier protein